MHWIFLKIHLIFQVSSNSIRLNTVLIILFIHIVAVFVTGIGVLFTLGVDLSSMQMIQKYYISKGRMRNITSEKSSRIISIANVKSTKDIEFGFSGDSTIEDEIDGACADTESNSEGEDLLPMRGAIATWSEEKDNRIAQRSLVRAWMLECAVAVTQSSSALDTA